jgi:hypothetical protein
MRLPLATESILGYENVAALTFEVILLRANRLIREFHRLHDIFNIGRWWGAG